jgi:hypothetical protein
MSTRTKEVTTERTTSGLIDMLFSEIDLLRNGKSNPHRASALAKLAVQVINTARLEIDVCALGPQRIKPVALQSVPALKLASSR